MKDRKELLTIIATALVDAGYSCAVYKDSVLLVPKDASQPRVVEVSALGYGTATTSHTFATMLEPHAGDTLVWDGRQWQLARRDGVQYYVEPAPEPVEVQ